MTTISPSLASTDAKAVPKVSTRNFSLDRARTFLTQVVLLHHAVIPYTYYGHTDPKEFFGFDMIVLATDSFFMAMFFFLSGLFVWPGIARKGPLNYLPDRLLRLGLPFVICAFTVIPLAYYAISLRQHPEIGFSEFWWNTITKGPWPSGPIWFLWVLLAFDVVACLLYRLSPNMLDPINRLSLHGSPRPAVFFAVMLAVTAMLYVPGLMYFGPASWLEFGPFSVQHGRVMLYATYFFFGAGIGVQHLDRGAVGGRRPDGEGQLGLDDTDDRSVLPHVGADLHQARKSGKSVAVAELVRGELCRLLHFLQRGHPVPDPGLFPEVRPLRQERARSDAVRCLRHVPGALSDHTVAAVLAVRFQYAGDRESTYRIRADGRVQLGVDAGVETDPGREKGAVAPPEGIG